MSYSIKAMWGTSLRSALPLFVIVLTCIAGADRASAQSPQYVPAYPLYCQGPLTTGAPSGRETTTPFIWSATGAGAANPGPGQCAWADRPAGGVEIQSGGGNVICDFSGAMQSAPAGQFIEVGVARDPLVSNCMHLARYIGAVSPPFSAVPALAPFVRQNIAAFTPAQIASLRHGIQVMMSRPSTDPTSYAYQANIHGTSVKFPLPSWNQCEHGSYYFLSWHRMYLYFFDRILRAAAGDPNLVLPYWNWQIPSQQGLPLPFQQPANASNPLYIAPPGRPSALDQGTAILGNGVVYSAGAFADTNFDSPFGSGASFGGQIASPMQFDDPHGDFETQPHDVVHVALGGLMSDPDTAAEDPIFWLHHANIDRLWSRWINWGGGRSDPSDSAWLNTRFTFYDEAGHAVYLTGAQIEQTAAQLNYRYDDDPLPVHIPPGHPRPPVLPWPRLKRFAMASAPLKTLAGKTTRAAGTPLIELSGATAHVQVPLTAAAVKRIRKLVETRARRRVFLRLDDIRYEKSSGVYYEVYLNPPAKQSLNRLNIRSPGYVGNLALFGLKPHAMPGRSVSPAAEGIFVQYDISYLVGDALLRNPNALNVVLVPRGLFDRRGEPLPVATKTQGTVGSVRVLAP